VVAFIGLNTVYGKCKELISKEFLKYFNYLYSGINKARYCHIYSSIHAKRQLNITM